MSASSINPMSTTKTATCKHCGASDVAWRQSNAGRWYLADVTTNPRGRQYTTTPHTDRCLLRQAAHAAERAHIDAAQKERADRARWATMSEQEKLAEFEQFKRRIIG